MGNNLSISLRLKFISLGHQAFAQLAIVFDNAVLDNGYAPAAVGMGMGIVLLGFAMGGPASMANPQASGVF